MLVQLVDDTLTWGDYYKITSASRLRMTQMHADDKEGQKLSFTQTPVTLEDGSGSCSWMRGSEIPSCEIPELECIDAARCFVPHQHLERSVAVLDLTRHVCK